MSDQLRQEERALAIVGCLFTLFVIACIVAWLVFGEP